MNACELCGASDVEVETSHAIGLRVCLDCYGGHPATVGDSVSSKSREKKRAARVNYHAYLQSPEWQAKRVLALDRAGGRCQLCNRATRLHVHHRTYERLGNEDLSDLTVLCADCHEHFHGKDGSKPRRVARSTSKRGQARRVEEREQIVAVLEGLPICRRYKTAEIAELAGVSVARTGTHLAALADAGRIRRSRRGSWEMTGRLRAAA